MKDSSISTNYQWQHTATPFSEPQKKNVVCQKTMSSVATEFIQISYPLSMISHDYLLYRHVCWLNPHFCWWNPPVCWFKKYVGEITMFVGTKDPISGEISMCVGKKKLLVKSAFLLVKKNLLVKSPCLWCVGLKKRTVGEISCRFFQWIWLSIIGHGESAAVARSFPPLVAPPLTAPAAPWRRVLDAIWTRWFLIFL